MESNKEQEKLKLLNENMYCKKYDMYCLDVPDEVLTFIGGFGFSCYECELECRECSEMEKW